METKYIMNDQKLYTIRYLDKIPYEFKPNTEFIVKMPYGVAFTSIIVFNADISDEDIKKAVRNWLGMKPERLKVEKVRIVATDKCPPFC